MSLSSWLNPRSLLSILAGSLLVAAVACGGSAPAEPIIVEKEVVKEVIKEVVVEKEVIKKVPVEVVVEKEVVKEVIKEVVVIATAVPAVSGPVTAKITRLRAALSPPIIELALGWRGTTVDANQQVRHFADPLLDTDSITGGILPGLATEWEMTKADGTEWTFKLRKGIQFHSGWGEFTANDVPNSINQVANSDDSKATDQFLLRELFGETEAEVSASVQVVDDYTIVFKLLRPEAELDFIATAQQGNLFMYSKAQWDKEGLEGYEKKPAATGPFKFEEQVLGSHILFSRVENHWRQTPAFEEYQQLFVPEAATRMAMMLAGEVQIAEINRDLHKRVVARGKKVLSSSLPGIQFSFIMGGVYRSDLADRYDPTVPATDIRVRQAINMAVNKQEIIDTLFAGAGEQLAVWAYHPALQGWNPRWEKEYDEKYGYNPERARELLAEAGYPNGFKMQLKITQLSGLPEMIPAAEAMFNYLQDIGIQVESEEMEWARVRENYRGKTTHNWIYPIRGTYRPPYVTLRFYNVSSLTGFISSYEDKEIDVRYDKMVNSVDREERTRLLREIGDIKFDNFAEVPIAWLPSQIVVDPDIIKEFLWPGNINAAFSHVEYIVPVAK